ncbi:MAG: hypothetical protein Ct9H300mP12_00120 [Acidimicrobiales bacterium]|nr:MAG: hypothetical protein Ct9H300mP12_00120 [Acidimicrobiales bacterium]
MVFRVAFKPTATISSEQDTVTTENEAVTWRPVAATTRACSLEPYLWWKPWPYLSWPTTGSANGQSMFFPD